MSKIQALLFDVFGTVVDWRSGVAREAAPFLERHIAGADPHAFADAWRRRYAPAMEEVRAGRRDYVRLDVLHRENLLAILPDFGIDPADVTDTEIDELNHAWHRLDPWPDAVAGLTRLKQRFIIAPLSNGNIRLMLDIAKRAGLPWDAILGAELVKTYKPRPEAYLGTADILGLHPSEICMVAAHNSDLAAARGCGLRTAFIPRHTEHGPGQTTDLTPADTWDHIADTIAALADQLGA
jgi:2-haloacid dehalogenase